MERSPLAGLQFSGLASPVFPNHLQAQTKGDILCRLRLMRKAVQLVRRAAVELAAVSHKYPPGTGFCVAPRQQAFAEWRYAAKELRKDLERGDRRFLGGCEHGTLSNPRSFIRQFSSSAGLVCNRPPFSGVREGEVPPPKRGVVPCAASLSQVSSPARKGGRQSSSTERPICPGCGIEMQDRDSQAPGFFKRPAVLDEVAGHGEDLSKEEIEEMERLYGADEEEQAAPSQGRQGGSSKWVVFESEGSKLVPVDEIVAGQREPKDVPVQLLGFGPAGPEYGVASQVDEQQRAAMHDWNRLWEEDEEVEEGGRASPKGDGQGPPEKLVVCARCHALRNYGQVKDKRLENLLPDFDFAQEVGARLRKAYGRRAVVVMVIDAADFDGSFPRRAAAVLTQAEEAASAQWKEGLPGNVFRLLVVANKADLLPKQVSHARLEQWVRRRARAGGAPRVSGCHLVSAQQGWGIQPLADSLAELAGPRGDVWVIGAQNAGKSSLINALSRVRKGARAAQLTEAALPGTTIGVVPLEGVLGGRARLLDTPGLLHPHQITTRLTREEQRLVQPRKHLKPRTFRIKVGQTVYIGGLARVDVVEAPAESLYLTVWASSYMLCHMGKEENAEAVFEKHVGERLQPPSGRDRLEELGQWLPRTVEVEGTRWDQSSTDVVIAGLGWVAVGLKGKGRLRVWTYEGVAVTVRDAMVFDMASLFEKAGFTAGKLPSLGREPQGEKGGKGARTAGPSQAKKLGRERPSVGQEQARKSRTA